MFPKDKLSLGKMNGPLQPIKDSVKGERAIEINRPLLGKKLRISNLSEPDLTSVAERDASCTDSDKVCSGETPEPTPGTDVLPRRLTADGCRKQERWG